MPTWRPSTSSSRHSKSWASEALAAARRLGLLVLLAVPGLVTAAGAPPALDEAVHRLEATYQGIRDLQASFQQASFNRTLNQTLEAKGTLYLKKPGKLRWEYTAPTPQEIVSDGKKLWVYTPELKQVNVTDAPSALAGPAGSFLQGLGQVREHFAVRFLNPAQPTDPDGLLVLDLTPKRSEPMLARLVLSVDRTSGLVRKAVVYDELGNTVTVRFLDMKVNPGLADKLFVFTPPPGVAVIKQ
ncbi:MAG TPA: outer membrane lipoprotein chaperone LolA [Methylomirabilota bacterium]|jgi:outer membrane lipoprotein carrier protein|nr:outer membrane lipoprotein chaperone LolA [Methylomirabilota bacterium]